MTSKQVSKIKKHPVIPQVLFVKFFTSSYSDALPHFGDSADAVILTGAAIELEEVS